jgi:hypothetical protein
LTQRSSTYSWISSRSTHPPPEFESAEETEVQPAKKDSEPEEIELTKEETKEMADPANEEMNPAEDEVEIAKEDEIEREAASERKNDLLSAETKAAVGLKQDSQVHGGYWCTACHNRYSERQSWQSVLVQVLWRNALFRVTSLHPPPREARLLTMPLRGTPELHSIRRTRRAKSGLGLRVLCRVPGWLGGEIRTRWRPLRGRFSYASLEILQRHPRVASTAKVGSTLAEPAD